MREEGTSEGATTDRRPAAPEPDKPRPSKCSIKGSTNNKGLTENRKQKI